jgi:hypothetical protein
VKYPLVKRLHLARSSGLLILGHQAMVEQRGERRDGWIGSLRRGEPLTGRPDEPAQGM